MAARVLAHGIVGELDGRFGGTPRHRRLAVFCSSGNRSARATALLTRFGFEAVSLNGGMRAWATARLAVETDNTQPTTVV